ncbi:MAG: branched-chain amino acid ABC transporter ATP-binding protein [Betaproteobacteria bacterium HGW-Betaproteobacteria-13]|jgi:branched-chain amino acid transport system ATP-binding protein|uniref:Branched-chain amino acid ABC transporter ATP-binding protein n=1 Tax=Parazoarcus communis TaxID=41977 RepID=A0A2U8GX91_9RHOO|nr:ABC transporter ATP-binding protein [Parazoarcus communis]AWI77903.1 branched-chain amino acid ABC transporter ATP-binding protein [Parazoarcus communis]PKO82526.1 MAG: branched-chain amino acid ABC transporter ATP-binding protein [Betaproteobacteria bacterium HGW-Betaproteobacteria-13]TVT56564.1 MAG: ABC transporter ATP-binding protein [Azoarcus sp. PHD]|tara:strand:- start:11681 stop:12388 length:708 start_codon:yes stop_codon:yes gene_type:complete
MLEVKGIRAGYGAINVLWDASLDFREGELTTVVGPNGAGKSTMLKAVMGLVAPTRGEIVLNGQSIGGTPTWEMPDRGLVLIPEGRMVFRDMSVEENLAMGAFPTARRAAVQRNIERAYTFFPRLKERRSQLAGSLSGGEAQMLAIGRGLMAEPRVLLVDEPSLGLAPVIVHEILGILRKLKEEGVTIVLVEQNTHLALGVADRVFLMRSGKVVLDQPASDVSQSDLHDLYFSLEH